MSKKHEPDNFEQMSIFGIMNLLDNTENTLSSDDISKIMISYQMQNEKENLSKLRRDGKKSVRKGKEKLVKQRNVRKPISEKLQAWTFRSTGKMCSIRM